MTRTGWGEKEYAKMTERKIPYKEELKKKSCVASDLQCRAYKLYSSEGQQGIHFILRAVLIKFLVLMESLLPGFLYN